jgi:hypothetical protein
VAILFFSWLGQAAAGAASSQSKKEFRVDCRQTGSYPETGFEEIASSASFCP